MHGAHHLLFDQITIVETNRAGIIAADHEGKSITKKSIVQLAKKEEFGCLSLNTA